MPQGKRATTGINVLILSAKGLFVFESKNYSGWIFGVEDWKNWCQTLHQGRGRSHKESFYNPIMQNRTYIKHLKMLLSEETPMHSIITFSERCTLKSVQVKSQDIHVINRYDVACVVSKISGQITEEHLSETQIQALYDKLYSYTQVDEKAKAQHIADIESKLVPVHEPPVAETVKPESAEVKTTEPIEALVPEQLKPPICPRCGSQLVLRQTKRGANAGNQFYGCSSYPECRYIRNLTETQ